MIEEYVKGIQPKYKEPIAAQVMPLTNFWNAEDYHQDYIEHNPGGGYVQTVSIPEIKKLQKQYPQLIKDGYKY